MLVGATALGGYFFAIGTKYLGYACGEAGN